MSRRRNFWTVSAGPKGSHLLRHAYSMAKVQWPMGIPCDPFCILGKLLLDREKAPIYRLTQRLSFIQEDFWDLQIVHAQALAL
jgi:hypothetical protein